MEQKIVEQFNNLVRVVEPFHNILRVAEIFGNISANKKKGFCIYEN